MFPAFAFSYKKKHGKMIQNSSHILASKISKKSPPVIRFRSQNGSELTSEGQKKNKMLEQRNKVNKLAIDWCVEHFSMQTKMVWEPQAGAYINLRAVGQMTGKSDPGSFFFKFLIESPAGASNQ